MKKLTLALVAALALSLGCGKEEKPAETAKPTDTAKPVDPAVKPADPAATPTDPAAKPADPAAAQTATDLPAECADYATRIEACLKHEKFPQTARVQTETAFNTMKNGWATLPSMPAEQKATQLKVFTQSCVDAIDAMSKSGVDMCPGVFPAPKTDQAAPAPGAPAPTKPAPAPGK